MCCVSVTRMTGPRFACAVLCEASTELLTRLADDASEKAAAALLPKVSERLCRAAFRVLG